MEPHSHKYKQICKGSKPLTLERCKCKNNEGIHGHNFQYGLDKKNEINDYWSIRNCINTTLFQLVMACDRLKKILRVFHIVDSLTNPSKDDPAYTPSCRVRPLLDYINTVCMHYFIPGQAIAIDESLIAGKVRNPIRQYLPNK